MWLHFFILFREEKLGRLSENQLKLSQHRRGNAEVGGKPMRGELRKGKDGKSKHAK